MTTELRMNGESPQKIRSTSNFFGRVPSHDKFSTRKSPQKTIHIVSERSAQKCHKQNAFHLGKLRFLLRGDNLPGNLMRRRGACRELDRHERPHQKQSTKLSVMFSSTIKCLGGKFLRKKLSEFNQKTLNWRRLAFSSTLTSWGTSRSPCPTPRRSSLFSSVSLIWKFRKLNLHDDDPIQALTFLPPPSSFHGFSAAFSTTSPGSHRRPYVSFAFLSSSILCFSDCPRESFQSSNRYPYELIYFCLNSG